MSDITIRFAGPEDGDALAATIGATLQPHKHFMRLGGQALADLAAK